MMSKRDIFKMELYAIAKESSNHQMETGEYTTYRNYIMEGITERTEKMFLKEWVVKLEKDIPRDRKLGISRNIEVYEKMLDIAKDRLEQIELNKK